jgi:hypothetical protein
MKRSVITMGPRAAPNPRPAKPAALLLAALLAACSKNPDAAAKRASIQAMGPASIRILPAPQQYPWCLAYTVSEKGVIRQLTMSQSNESLPCKAGEAIGDTTYAIPPAEGKVRVYVIFSDRKLDALPIGAQVHEMAKSPAFSAMDLRAPGLVLMETLDFTPQKP